MTHCKNGPERPKAPAFFRTLSPRIGHRLLFLLLLLPLASCKLPDVRVTTPEPIKVDIAVRVDLYQHTATDKKKPGDTADTATANPTKPVITREQAETRRRDRMQEIQNLKNSRLVGENRSGLLDIRTQPPGEYGEYVKTTTEAENADRLVLMQAIADERKLPLSELKTEQAALWRGTSFPGEWIEIQQDTGEWVWRQKAK